MKWSLLGVFLLLVPGSMGAQTSTCVVPKEIDVVCQYIKMGGGMQGIACIDRRGKQFTTSIGTWRT